MLNQLRKSLSLPFPGFGGLWTPAMGMGVDHLGYVGSHLGYVGSHLAYAYAEGVDRSTWCNQCGDRTIIGVSLTLSGFSGTCGNCGTYNDTFYFDKDSTDGSDKCDNVISISPYCQYQNSNYQWFNAWFLRSYISFGATNPPIILVYLGHNYFDTHIYPYATWSTSLGFDFDCSGTTHWDLTKTYQSPPSIASGYPCGTNLQCHLDLVF